MSLSWGMHQELSKLLMYRQNTKEIKPLDGPLKNWAIFYGRSVIVQVITKTLEIVYLMYSHQCLVRKP